MRRFSRQTHREFGAAHVAEPTSSSAARDNSPVGREVAAFYAALVGSDNAGQTAPPQPDAAPVAEAPALPPPAAATAAAAGLEPAPEPAPEGVEILPPMHWRLATDGRPTAAPAEEPGGPGPGGGADARRPSYGIPRGNVGFQLLVKSGWKEGTGLGAEEQGRREPVVPHRQEGGLGLGYERKPRQAATSSSAAAQQQQGGPAAAAQQEVRAGAARPPLPEDSLDKQSTEAKVKRVKQVMQAEADEAATKAIQRYIYRAFSDATGEPTSDANPLLRRSRKTSATNPLL